MDYGELFTFNSLTIEQQFQLASVKSLVSQIPRKDLEEMFLSKLETSLLWENKTKEIIRKNIKTIL
jgi:hypothetical protein